MIRERPRIMIVEDEFLIAEELRERLESLGYQVTTAVDSGEEALQMAREEKPQVVLMDIQLQGQMNGIETAAALQRDFGIPCIYVTAYADDSMLEQAATTEHAGYLIKPYRDKELQAAIKAALHRSKIERDRRQSAGFGRGSPSNGGAAPGILTICSECKKIRDKSGAWQAMEPYMREHMQTKFSHSLCLDCLKKLYPDIWEKLRDKDHL